MTKPIQTFTILNEMYMLELKAFFNQLGQSEKRYFKRAGYSLVNQSSLVLTESDHSEVIGVCGIEHKFRIARWWMVVKRDHWGKGVGRKMICRGRDILRTNKMYHAILGVCEKENIASIKAMEHGGYVRLGERDSLAYMILPVTLTGSVVVVLVKAIFPLVHIVDLFRN